MMATEIAAKTSQHKIQLNALMGFSDGGTQLLSGSTFEAEAEEALEYVMSGRVEVAKRHFNPPFLILKKLNWQLEYLDQIGPEWNETNLLQKFQNGALANGVRLAIVDGKQLHWIEGSLSHENTPFMTGMATSEALIPLP